MSEPWMLDFQAGRSSFEATLELAKTSYRPIFDFARHRLSLRGFSPVEASAHVDTAAWRIISTWSPAKGASLRSLLRNYLYRASLDYGTGWARKRSHPVPEALEQVIDQLEVRQPYPFDERIIQEETEKEVRDLYSLIPGTEDVQRCLIDVWTGGYDFEQGVKHTARLLPRTPRRKVHELAQKLRRILSHYYKEKKMGDPQTQGTENKTEAAPPPTTENQETGGAAPEAGKKESSPKKAGSSKKGNGKAKPEASAAKPGKGKKGAAVPAAETETKEEAKSTEETKDADAPAEEGNLVEDKIGEADIDDRVKGINELITEQEHVEGKNDWRIGRELATMRKLVTKGTWTRICTEKIQGIGGRVLSKSSLDKKMKLFNAFPKDEARAVAIGVGRHDAICRIKMVDDRASIVSDGIRVKKGEEPRQVESFTVTDLKKIADQINGLRKPKVQTTPQHEFSKKFNSKVKSFIKFLDESSEARKRVFESEDYATFVEARKALTASLKGIEIREKASRS